MSDLFDEMKALAKAQNYLRWSIQYLVLSLAFDVASIFIVITRIKEWRFAILLNFGGWISFLIARHYRKEADRSLPLE